MLRHFPDELLLGVIHYLDQSDTNAFAQTCRYMHNIADQCLYKRDAKYSSSALLWAAEHGKERTARKALASGADVNAVSILEPPEIDRHQLPIYELDQEDFQRRCRPLELAIWGGHAGMVKLLLAVDGIKVNVRDNMSRKSPMLQAVERNKEEIVSLLLSARDIMVELSDRWCSTPLVVAASKGYNGIIKVLLRQGRLNVNIGCMLAKSPLWQACRFGHESTVRLLLAAGADANGAHNEYPLETAASRGFARIVKYLLVSPTFRMERLREPFESLRCHAAKNGQDQVLRELCGANYSEINWDCGSGRSCLWWAAAHGNERTINFLLSIPGVDVNVKTTRGLLPVFAIEAMRAGMGGAASGVTPLMIAAFNGHLGAVVRLLKVEGIDVHAQDACGESALSMARWARFPHVVNALMAWRES